MKHLKSNQVHCTSQFLDPHATMCNRESIYKQGVYYYNMTIARTNVNARYWL